MPVYVAVLIISLMLSVALAPKPPQPKPAAISDFDLPQTDEGTPVPVVFGDGWISGWTVLAYGNLRSHPIFGPGKK